MNREEAVQICKEVRHRLWILDEQTPIWDKGAVSEAILMAIEALEREQQRQEDIYECQYCFGEIHKNYTYCPFCGERTDNVHCEECKHKADNYCYKHSHEVTDSDFCSYGERSEE